MLSSYLKTAIRNIVRRRLNSLINILGLAIGLACCFLVLQYIQFETGYDKFHEKHARIYRLYEHWHPTDGPDWTRSVTGPAPGYRIKDAFPQVESVVRFLGLRKLVTARDKNIYEDRVSFADAEVFDVFSFRLLEGNPSTALKEPYSMVISGSMARKYFGNDNPIGETIRLDSESQFKVTGVFEDLPDQSHLRFDFLASFQTLIQNDPSFNDNWDNITRTYLLLSERANPDAVRESLIGFVKKYRDEETAAKLTYGLQPLDEIHTNPTSVDFDDATPLSKLYLFGAIALFILIIAIVNFVNLSTAQYAGRVQEVSVRKVLGASQQQVRRQFLFESLVVAFVSAAVAMVLVELFLPAFENIAQINLNTSYLNNPFTGAGLIGLTVLVGLGGGIYPAIVLASYNPMQVLRNTLRSGRTGVFWRRALVVIQFAISAALILGTVVVYDQYRFLTQKNLGFDTENLVKLEVTRDSRERLITIKGELLKQPGVISVTGSTYGSDYGITVQPYGSEKDIPMVGIFVDHDFVSTLGLRVDHGRDFSDLHAADEVSAVLFNQRTLDLYGNQFAVGSGVLTHQGKLENAVSRTVIGTLDNFHFRNITRFTMQPVALIIDPSRIENLLIRIDGRDPVATIRSIGDVYRQFVPGRPFEYTFLEDELRLSYAAELRQSTLLGYSCSLAIFVALIGLFGLVLHMTQQRAKEIGIRKVFGASSRRIVTMLASEFLLLILLANIVALPIAYYFLKNWLWHYPYRIDLNLTYIVFTITVLLIMGILTVSYQSLRSARSNPVDALKYE